MANIDRGEETDAVAAAMSRTPGDFSRRMAEELGRFWGSQLQEDNGQESKSDSENSPGSHTLPVEQD